MKCRTLLWQVNTVTFSPDGSLCITGSDDTRLMVWDVDTGARKLVYQTPHTNNIFCGTFTHSACLSVLIGTTLVCFARILTDHPCLTWSTLSVVHLSLQPDSSRTPTTMR